MTSRHTYLKPGDGPDMGKTGKLTSIKADLHTVMETVLDGLIIIDSDGLIQTFNLAAEKIFGYTPEEVIGRNVNMLMPEPYHSQHDGYLSHYLKTGEKKVIGIGREVSGRRKNGSVFPMELGINEMPVGGSRMFVGTIRDITERKEAEERAVEEAARLMAITNTVLDGLITINEQGEIQTFNPAAEYIFGYTQEEVIGQNLNLLVPQSTAQRRVHYFKDYLRTGEKKVLGVRREFYGVRKDGTRFPWNSTSTRCPWAASACSWELCGTLPGAKKMSARFFNISKLLNTATRNWTISHLSPRMI